jgi:hypothetical protein
MAKTKKEKKPKEYKSIEDRIIIADTLKEKIQNLGIPSIYPGIVEFYKILDEYCKDNIISGFSGKIKLPEISRYIEYILPIRKEIEHVVKITAQ